MRAALRTTLSAEAPGPTQANSDSRLGHTGRTAPAWRKARTWSSTRSAVRRRASSRSASRLPLRKKFAAARSARWSSPSRVGR